MPEVTSSLRNMAPLQPTGPGRGNASPVEASNLNLSKTFFAPTRGGIHSSVDADIQLCLIGNALNRTLKRLPVDQRIHLGGKNRKESILTREIIRDRIVSKRGVHPDSEADRSQDATETDHSY